MKKLNLLLLLLLPFLYGCKDNCEGIDCLSVDAFAFTIKSGETGEDLLFGNNAQLKPEDVEVHYLLNGSRQAANVRFESNFVWVGLNHDVTEYLITALNQTDTIQVDFSRTRPSECCPSSIEVNRITANGKPVNEDSFIIALSR
jgi:hypothetical protein